MADCLEALLVLLCRNQMEIILSIRHKRLSIAVKLLWTARSPPASSVPLGKTRFPVGSWSLQRTTAVSARGFPSVCTNRRKREPWNCVGVKRALEREGSSQHIMLSGLLTECFYFTHTSNKDLFKAHTLPLTATGSTQPNKTSEETPHDKEALLP